MKGSGATGRKKVKVEDEVKVTEVVRLEWLDWGLGVCRYCYRALSREFDDGSKLIRS